MTPASHHLSADHLSDDQLDDLLLGLGTPHAQAHLAACSACAARKAAFTEAIAGFNHATLAWSQAKSNTLTRDLAAAAHPQSSPRLGLALAAAATVAVAAALVGTGTLPLHGHDPQPTAAAPFNPEADRTGEIDRDNAMLQEIDAALQAPEPSPEQLYRLPGNSTGAPPDTEVRE